MRAPSAPTLAAPRDAFEESGCLGMQPKAGGKSHLRLNTDGRPIANKYREGKMKRTLKRELKVLEIVEGEGIGGCGCSRAYGARQRLCMHRVPVSIGCSGGIKAAFCRPPMPPGRSRSKGTPVCLQISALTMLAEGLQSARLETRTKESNMYASGWVANP